MVLCLKWHDAIWGLAEMSFGGLLKLNEGSETCVRVEPKSYLLMRCSAKLAKPSREEDHSS
jgi:hypothetical protein